MNFKKALPFIVLVALAIIAVFIKQCANNATDVKPSTHTTTRGLNRNPAHINYSKHARCRMQCRHITESEVQDILKNGKINYSKSELNADDCQKKYAVEGVSHDNQKLRIIFAPCSDEETVVTVIDLGTEWPCNCE